jgi:hypothetical protein
VCSALFSPLAPGGLPYTLQAQDSSIFNGLTYTQVAWIAKSALLIYVPGVPALFASMIYFYRDSLYAHSDMVAADTEEMNRKLVLSLRHDTNDPAYRAFLDHVKALPPAVATTSVTKIANQYR